jgi:hypothetical protein
MTKIFNTKVVGVTHKNPDGTERQKIIKKCKNGERVNLIRQPDNPYDKWAVGVFRQSGEQIGWIDKYVCGPDRLAEHLDFNGEVKAKIIKIIGGPSGILDRFFNPSPKNYGCVLELEFGKIPCDEKGFEAKQLIDQAKTLEEKNPDKALKLYIDAIKKSFEADKMYNKTPAASLYPDVQHRYINYPINRMSLVLERNKRYKECLKIIEQYENIKDKRGLPKSDIESIRKRKARVLKKLSQ